MDLAYVFENYKPESLIYLCTFRFTNIWLFFSAEIKFVNILIIYSYHTLILRTSFGAPLSNPRIALDTPDLGVGNPFWDG